MTITTKALSKKYWNDFVSYFEFQGKCSGCWCMNHRLPMGLDFEGEAAKLAMKELVLSERVHGVLAYEDGDPIPVGWASLDRKKTLPGHDCIGQKIDCSDHEWSIHCVTIRPDKKNLGIEKVLIKAATDLAIEYGAKRIEGYPEPNSSDGVPYKTWNSFNGFQSCYDQFGYKKYGINPHEVMEFYQPMEHVVESSD